ncbi:MAG: hypothetical protein DRG78_14930 [Epsilonproteobacteria bacterium]|nr:MAG: hypothetical protein DRG78_14930 [Campylobacterota bacterium]
MFDNKCLALVRTIIDLQKDLVVVFEGDTVVLTNKAFNRFFNLASLESYLLSGEPFVNHFVPHPSYFHKDKIVDNLSWFEAMQELLEIDRVVSMVNSRYEPLAFSVDINDEVKDLKIVTFEDITQSLIKRIMIDNHANVDEKSGAYSKSYFMQILQSYEEAAVFNEKIIAATLIKLNFNNALNEDSLQEFTQDFKKMIREEDMLVHWDNDDFILVYLVDTKAKANQVTQKLKSISNCEFIATTQEKNETLKSIVKRLSEMS